MMPLFLTSVSGSGVQYTLAADTDGIVMPDVVITSDTTAAVALAGINQGLAVLGAIGGRTSAILMGVSANESLKQTLTIGSTGQLIGEFSGVEVRGDLKRILNHGDITTAFGDGINGSGLSAARLVITNFGHILGADDGISVSTMAAYVVNSGTISGVTNALNFSNMVDDKVYNCGTLAGNVALGGGANLLYNYGDVTGNVSMGAGNDTLINSRGSINGAISLDFGDNTIRNSGDIGGNITFGGGRDLLVNRPGGTIDGDINMGDVTFASGGDTVFNRGLIAGTTTFGTSSDTFNNRGGTVDGRVFMGNGHDSFDNRGGTILDRVDLDGGNDTYILGVGAQVVDGGTGSDRLDLSRGGGLIFNTASTAGQAGLPADCVFTGFETVIGSMSGSNTITGDGALNIFVGGRSVDKLYGGGGNDLLDGGEGNDFLIGGAGKDNMLGGAGADTFLFAAGDSIQAGFDEISGFSKADKDIINLASIDAIASSSSDQAFTFIGAAAFTNVAGQLRYCSGFLPGATPATFIEGDTNGDGTADVVIALVGNIVLAATDFVL